MELVPCRRCRPPTGGTVINIASVAGLLPGRVHLLGIRGWCSSPKAWPTAWPAGVVCTPQYARAFVHTEFHERAGIEMSSMPEAMWLSVGDVVDEPRRHRQRQSRQHPRHAVQGAGSRQWSAVSALATRMGQARKAPELTGWMAGSPPRTPRGTRRRRRLSVVFGRVTLSSGMEADPTSTCAVLHYRAAPLIGRLMRELTGDYAAVGGLTMGLIGR